MMMMIWDQGPGTRGQGPGKLMNQPDQADDDDEHHHHHDDDDEDSFHHDDDDIMMVTVMIHGDES
eukprot:4819914-Karenia_brevis.AAC.1